MAIFVLVHGGWEGGWVWRDVARLLRAAGHDVYTPTLTGLGEREHLASPAITLDTHIADIMNVIKYEELKDVVLCGHSYGGMVITGVADRCPDRVASLVYLDAFVPENDCSALHYVPEGRRAHFLELARLGEGWRIPVLEAEDWGVIDPAAKSRMEQLSVAHPVRTLQEPIKLRGDWRSVKSMWYIVATLNEASSFTKFFEAAKGDPDWHCAELPCGHMANIEMPDAVARLLDQAGSGAVQ